MPIHKVQMSQKSIVEIDKLRKINEEAAVLSACTVHSSLQSSQMAII